MRDFLKTVAALAIAFAGLRALYGPVLDAPLVLDDRHVLASAYEGVGEFFPDLARIHNRPLARASLCWDRLWFPGAFSRGALDTQGLWAPGAFAGPRISNLLIHLLNGFCLWLLAAHWLFAPGAGRKRAASFAAACFWAHPLCFSAAGYLAQRSTLLATAGILLSVIGFLAAAEPHRRTAGRMLAVCGAAAAMLSHPVGILAPGFWVLAGRIRLGEGDRLLRKIMAGLCLAAVLAGAVLAWAQARSGEARSASSAVLHWTSVPAVAVRGLSLATLPRGQHLDWDLDRGTGAAGLMVIAAALIWASRRSLGGVAAGWWGLACWAPLIVPLADPFFEHRLYLGMVAVSLAAGGALRSVPRAGAWPPFAVLALLALLTLDRAWTWASPLRLWSESARHAPRKARAHVNAGTAWGLAHPERARAHYLQALAVDPENVSARENLRIVERRLEGRQE